MMSAWLGSKLCLPY